MSEQLSLATATSGGDARFLDHLTSAAELVSARRFREAEDEVLRGLAIVPADLRALKLLALVRFKLGRLEEAYAACREIAVALPRDPGIRLKLGLIALKRDRIDESVQELETCVSLAPDDLRAWSYLGFAYARRGEASRAAAAFRRAGEETHAVQVEGGAVMVPRADGGDDSGAAPGPGLPTASTGLPLDTGLDARASRSSVSDEHAAPGAPSALESVFELSASLRPGAKARDADQAAATNGTVEQAADVSRVAGVAATAGTAGTAGAAGTAPVSSLVGYAVAHLAPATNQAAWVGATARLAIGDGVFVRRDAAVACTGNARWQQAERRVRGRSTGTPLGEPGPGVGRFFRVTDGGDLFVGAPSGRLVPLRLEDDILYLREDCVLAFEGSVSWEYGQIPRSGLPILQFRGRGLVAIRVAGEPGAVKVTDGRPVFASSPHLLGWIGRVVARGIELEPDASAAEGEPPFNIACEGEGVVLMDIAAGARHS